METHSERVRERICPVFCALFRLLLLVKYKVLHVLALVIVTCLFLLLWQRFAFCHRHKWQVKVLLFLLWVHKSRHWVLKNDTGAFLGLGFDLLFSFGLAFAHGYAGREFAGLAEMLRKIFIDFVGKLAVAGELIRHGGVKGVVFMVVGVGKVVHEGGLVESLLIALVVIGEAGEVVFELTFEGSGFIDWEVRLILSVEHVLSSLNVIAMIGWRNTNICGACLQRFVLSRDCAIGWPSL